MFSNSKRLTAAVVSLVMGLGAGSVAVGAALDNLANANSEDMSIGSIIDQSIDFSDGPVQCQIVADSKNGMVTLESVVHAQMQINGSYVLMIASQNGSNRSRVQQGGNFVADADQSAVLGKMMISNRGATYDVNLKITVDGQYMECSEKFEV